MNKLLIGLLVLMSCRVTITWSRDGDVFHIYDEVHKVECTYSINEQGYAVSEDPAYIGTGICWDKRMMDKANFHIRSHKK